MDGMILAAGLGSRLRPLTDSLPKALIPVQGVPMLEVVARRMIAAGVDRLILNVHHHAEQIQEFVRSRGDFGVDVQISLEPDRPLDTGGGIKHAAPLFRGDRPILVHNVDVLTSVNLGMLIRAHEGAGALGTLAVRRPAGDRYLLLSPDSRFCGYGSTSTGHRVLATCSDETALREVEFCGIQVLDPEFLHLVTEEGVFSTIYVYARLAENERVILGHDIGDALWIDIGSPEQLQTANDVQNLSHLIDPRSL